MKAAAQLPAGLSERLPKTLGREEQVPVFQGTPYGRIYGYITSVRRIKVAETPVSAGY